METEHISSGMVRSESAKTDRLKSKDQLDNTSDAARSRHGRNGNGRGGLNNEDGAQYWRDGHAWMLQRILLFITLKIMMTILVNKGYNNNSNNNVTVNSTYTKIK